MKIRKYNCLLLFVMMLLLIFSGCDSAKQENISDDLPFIGKKTEKTTEDTKPNSTPEDKEITRGKVSTLSVSDDFIIGIRNDGSVYAIGGNSLTTNWKVDSWDDIIQVSAGINHLVGLRENGMVVATGVNSKRQCEVYEWTDIVDIHSGLHQTFGLRSDGTVIATSINGSYLLEGWENIVSITGCGDQLWGLTENGDVYSRSGPVYSSVKSVHANAFYAIFVLKDGTVVADPFSEDYAHHYTGIENWTDIVEVSTLVSHHVVGLRSDGTVVAVGKNEDGRCNVNEWTDIVSVATGSYHTVGLRSDGTVVAAGGNGYGQCDVSEWEDIIAIYASDIVTVGLKSDGTVVAAGSIWNGFGGIENFKDIKTQ